MSNPKDEIIEKIFFGSTKKKSKQKLLNLKKLLLHIKIKFQEKPKLI